MLGSLELLHESLSVPQGVVIAPREDEGLRECVEGASTVVVEDLHGGGRGLAHTRACLADNMARPYKVIVLLVGDGPGVRYELAEAKQRGWPVVALCGTEHLLDDNEGRRNQQTWTLFPKGGTGAEFASFLHLNLSLDLS